jgi:TRAP-type C4-dicarboxylate transport system permease small subunit
LIERGPPTATLPSGGRILPASALRPERVPSPTGGFPAARLESAGARTSWKQISMTAAYVSLISAISRLLGLVAMCLTGSAALVVTHMVIVRYFLNGSTVWQTEYVIYSLVAATFLGSPYVLLHKGHVNVDLLQLQASPGLRRLMQTMSGLVGVAFCALLAWSGWLYLHEAWVYDWTTDSVARIPLWIPLFPLPLGIGVLVLQYLAEIIKIYGGVE